MPAPLLSQSEVERICGELSQGNRTLFAGFLRKVEAAEMPGLSAPKVRLVPYRVSDGQRIVPAVTRVGELVLARGTLVASIEGCPARLREDPTIFGTLELVRYLPKHTVIKRLQDGSRQKFTCGQGFVHPANIPLRAVPLSATRRGEVTDMPLPRTTEWSLTGLPFASKVLIGVEELALFFRVRNVEDNLGNSNQALGYVTKRKARSRSGVWSYSSNPYAGVFAFRFAYFDSASGEWVTGPLSDPVYARPGKWPAFDKVEDIATPAYPRIKEVSRARSLDYLTLVCSVGGRVVGKASPSERR